MRSIFALLLILLAIPVFAQDPAKLFITVTSPKDKPLEDATVALHKASDSTLVKIALSDKNGIALFDKVAAGNYFYKISLSGYAPIARRVQVAGETTTPVKLEPAAKELSAVTVTSKKPFIQRLSDRLVVNVENSIVSTGSSALDVLERSPGVNVDQNDNISLRGRSGVIIMIDGKPSPMSGADLANYLRALPSASLDRIEIITNPSAKYDASGNSGIIDIRLKKDQRMGINGSLNASYGQGVFPKANGGGSFNYRSKKVNIFGNYNYSYRVNLNHLKLDRNFYEDGVYNGGDLKDNYSKAPYSSHTPRIGMDFFPSKKTIIGFVVNGNFAHFTRNNNNQSVVIDPNKQATSFFTSLATNNDHNRNAVANINFKHSFNKGVELTADADYGIYRNNSLSLNATSYYQLNGMPQQPDYVLQGDQEGELELKTAKVDLVYPMGKTAKWETGVKTSFVSSDNDAKFFDVSSGTPVNDANKTNHFLYKENNNAAYLNYKQEFKKFDMQLGLRGEQTNISTEQLMGNLSFDSSYFQLFPSAFFNYKIKEDQTIGVSVSRRIDRPGYYQLNPFLFLIDVTTYATGRPGLLPQFTWSYELNYTLKNINFTLGYSHTKNNQNIAIARFRDVFPNIPAEPNVTVQIPINLGSSEYYGLTVSAPVRISSWWNMVNNGNVYYQKYTGSLGTTKLDDGRPAFDARTNNTFTLKKGWTMELNGSFNSGGRYGFMEMDPQWGVGAGVQKTVLKNKGTVRFNVTDIFWTQRPKAVITYDNYIEKWNAYRETRVATIGFSYRFGNNKVQAARKRTTASEEETRRVN